MPLPPRRERARSLARTYGGDRDPWERVEEFQRVLEYRGEHPNKGSSAVASALELPRGRIRPWFDGSKPDPVHAIDAAEARGWLDAEYGDPRFDALTVLHAWIFGGGSIEQTRFVPTFVISAGDPDELCRAALEQAGLDVRQARPNEPARAGELAPRADASILGRFLHGVLGAPLGEKNDRIDLSLPDWLTTAPAATQSAWAQTYVTLRGTELEPGHGYTVQVGEQRTAAFRQSIGDLLAGVTTAEDVTVTAHAILLRPAAATVLTRTPSL